MTDEEPEDTYAAPLEWHFGDNIIPRYATNMLVQSGDHEFYVAFFETIPPIVMGTPEERHAQAAQVTSVRAECVGRIVIARDRLPGFVQVLQRMVEMNFPELVERKGEEK
jgi:hypothetical protein